MFGFISANGHPSRNTLNPEADKSPNQTRLSLRARLGALGVGVLLGGSIGTVAGNVITPESQVSSASIEQALIRTETAASAARTEKYERQRLLEVNQAKEIATVRTDSGMTLRFYVPGVHENVPIDVDPKSVNDMTNFAIASLSELDQDYMPKADIIHIQQRAAQGKLDNVDVAIMFCSSAYNKPVQGSGWVQTKCGGDGWMSGIPTYERGALNQYYPTLMASWTFRSHTSLEDAQMIQSKFPNAITPEFFSPGTQETLRQGVVMDRSLSITNIALHELGHVLPYLGANTPDYVERSPDQAHTAIVSPLQRLGAALLCDLPGIQNPTPYNLSVSFGVNGDPIGEERAQLVAAGASNFYPLR